MSKASDRNFEKKSLFGTKTKALDNPTAIKFGIRAEDGPPDNSRLDHVKFPNEKIRGAK